MGNCVSASTHIHAPTIRVVQAAQGRVVDVEVPILQSSMKVGELMLEFPPGHFVAQLLQADFLASTGKRATPLGADTDATPGTLYLLFPMPRLHTRITPQELLSFSKLLHLHDQQLAKAAYSPSKVQVHSLFTAGARVVPLAEEQCKDDANLHTDQRACPLQQNEQEPISYNPDSSLFMRSCHGQMQVIKHKPWAPKLQTIKESS